MNAARIHALAKAQRLTPRELVGKLLQLAHQASPDDMAAQWRAVRAAHPSASDAPFCLLQTPPASFAKGDVSEALDAQRDASVDG